MELLKDVAEKPNILKKSFEEIISKIQQFRLLKRGFYDISEKEHKYKKI